MIAGLQFSVLLFFILTSVVVGPPELTTQEATGAPLGCAGDTILQLLYIQDVSHSYTNDMSNMAVKIPQLMEELEVSFFGREVAVASFSDKPIRPVGDPNGDHCYAERTAFTAEADEIAEVVASLSMLSGLDWKESQFDAIKHGLKSSTLGWQSNDWVGDKHVMRVVMIATDSFGHVNGTFPGMPADSPLGCAHEDYPSLESIQELLKEYNVFPIFIVTSDIFNLWNRKLSHWEEKEILRLSDSVDDIVSSIKEVLVDVCATSTTTTTSTTTSTTTRTLLSRLGCGDAMTILGPNWATCEVVCDRHVCSEEDTFRINTDHDECEAALEARLGGDYIQTTDTSPFYNEGCATAPDEVRHANLKPTTLGCDAPPGTGLGTGGRACCCVERPITTTTTTTATTTTTTTTTTTSTTTSESLGCGDAVRAFGITSTTCAEHCDRSAGTACSEEDTLRINTDASQCIIAVENWLGEPVGLTTSDHDAFNEGCSAAPNNNANLKATTLGCDAAEGTGQAGGNVVRICCCNAPIPGPTMETSEVTVKTSTLP